MSDHKRDYLVPATACLMVTTWITTTAVADPTLAEKQIVQKLMGAVKDVSRDYVPVEATTVVASRTWLQRTTDRLDWHIDTTLFAERVRPWRRRLKLDLLQTQLNRQTPDLREMRAVLSALDTTLADVAGQDRLHVIESVRRALIQYITFEEDRRDPIQASRRLASQLTDLQTALEGYLANGGRAKSLDTSDATNKKAFQQLSRVHEIVESLRLQHQLPALTQELRQHYLQTKVVVEASSELIGLAADFQLPAIPVERQEGRVRVTGTANLTGRLRMQLVPCPEYAIVRAVYDGPVVFQGSAGCRRTSLGVTANMRQNMRKVFYVSQDAPDSARARSQTQFLFADTSRGRFVDRLANRGIRRQFDADAMNDRLELLIDQLVTELANLAPRRYLPVLRELTESVPYLVVRHYQTTADSIQLQVRSSRDGFHAPQTEVPEIGDASFALSVHRSIVHEIALHQVAGKQRAQRLREIRQQLGGLLQLDLPEDDRFQLWFPDTQEEQVVFLSDRGDLNVSFLACLDDGREYPCRFTLSDELSRQGIDFTDLRPGESPCSFTVLGDADEPGRIELERVLRQRAQSAVAGMHLRPAMQGGLPTGGQEHWEELRNRLSVSLRYENQYLTLSGNLRE